MPRARGTAGRQRRAAPLRVVDVVGEAEGDLQLLLREQPASAERFVAAVMFTEIARPSCGVPGVEERSWADLVDICGAIVCRQAARYNGRLVRSDDGPFVRFSGAYSAVRCALAIRQDLHELGVDLRAGLHAGEGNVRDADIIDAIAHVANRICSLADAGRVLTSRVLADLVAGSGVVFGEAGTYRLGDVPGEWQLFAVGE